MTERLHFHFLLSCIGEGNGNPLQCSCLENPRDRGAWWAAVYGVAQRRTRLKRLSSSSSSRVSNSSNSVSLKWENHISLLNYSTCNNLLSFGSFQTQPYWLLGEARLSWILISFLCPQGSDLFPYQQGFYHEGVCLLFIYSDLSIFF